MDIAFLVALVGRGVKRCGLTDVFFFFEALYLSAADGKMWLIRVVLCCL